MCLESGLQLTCIKPADPSSILHFQSGFSNENTWTKFLLFKLHKINSESFDHFIFKFKRVKINFVNLQNLKGSLQYKLYYPNKCKY